MKAIKSLFKSLFLSILAEVIHMLPAGNFKYMLVGNIVKYKLYTRKIRQKIFADKGDIVVQSGAWRLETILYWLEAVGDTGEVIGIEADTENSKLLQYEIDRRGIINTIIINKAISNYKGTAILQVSNHSRFNQLKERQSYNYFVENETYDHEKEVIVDKLDNILNDIGKKNINMVSLQISGAEKDALEGMSLLLEKGCKLYIRSIFADQEDHSEPVYKQVISMLKSYKYKIYLSPSEKNRMGGRNIYAFKKQN